MTAACLRHMRLCLLQLPGDVPAAGLPLEVLQDLHGEHAVSVTSPAPLPMSVLL